MTATAQLPPTAKATVDTVLDGLAEIRARLAEIDAPDMAALGELPGHLVGRASERIDRATGRNRRPRWPFLALGMLAAVGLAVGVAMFVMSRNGLREVSDEMEREDDRVWSPGSARRAPTSHSQSMSDLDAESFPASDPLQTPMSPGIGS